MIIRSAILVTVLAGLAGLCSADTIVNNVNPGGAYTQAANPGVVTWTPSGPAFTLTSTTLITEVFTYHQNGIAPATVDSVGIEDTDTDTFYWWTANTESSDGLGQWAYPNVVVPAGDYVVIDQSPATWSMNTASGWTGMSEVDGTVPEPASVVLLAPGLLFLLRKRRAA
jgi:hypothetical protein